MTEEIESTTPAPQSPDTTGDDPFEVSPETTVPQTTVPSPKNDEVPTDEVKRGDLVDFKG